MTRLSHFRRSSSLIGRDQMPDSSEEKYEKAVEILLRKSFNGTLNGTQGRPQVNIGIKVHAGDNGSMASSLLAAGFGGGASQGQRNAPLK